MEWNIYAALIQFIFNHTMSNSKYIYSNSILLLGEWKTIYVRVYTDFANLLELVSVIYV